MPVITKINTNAIADDAITAEKYALEASGYVANTTNQDLSGTYSDNRLYTSDAYTVTGDVNVTGHLALGSVADSDIVITQDSTERTITGSGTLESGRLLNDVPSLTGMTGELGSAVTGSPNLNLGNSSFPAGHVIQVVSDTNESEWSHNTSTATPTPYSQTITPSSNSNKILITFASPLRVMMQVKLMDLQD